MTQNASAQADKYRRLHDATITAHAVFQAWKATDADDVAGCETAEIAFYESLNAFFDIIINEFDGEATETTKQEVGDLFNNPDHPLRWKEGLTIEDAMSAMSNYSDAAMAIYATRVLLSLYRVTFDPAKLKHWDTFSERYQDLILSA
jgi:hypothetical protein